MIRLGHLLLIAGVLVASATPALGKIPCLSGFVRDSNGTPIAGGDLDFTDSATGVRLVTPGDNTDSSGFYSVCVLPGIYDVSFAPPPRSNLRGLVVSSVDLRNDPGLELDVVLPFGSPVNGVIRDQGGNPVGNVDVDVDSPTEGRIYTPDDNSDPVTGSYWVVVPDGTFQFRFEPEYGSRIRGRQINAVVVAGATTLDVTLQEGFLLSGRVSDSVSGAAVFDADIGLRDAGSGEKVFLSNNSTLIDGKYSVAAPAGSFELRIEPPRTSHYIAQSFRPFEVVDDTSQDVQLDSGLLLRVLVRDSQGAPIAGADLDVKRSDTGEKLFTPHDRSTLSGETVAVVPAGTYDISVEPPLGSPFDRVVSSATAIATDREIIVVLPDLQRVSASLRVTDQFGAPVPGTQIHAYRSPSATPAYLGADLTDENGDVVLWLVPGQYDLTLSPPVGVRLAGVRVPSVSIFDGAILPEAQLQAGFVVDLLLTTADGVPVTGADVDFLRADSGVEVFTPRDNSDAEGKLSVVVVGATYDLIVEAPAGGNLSNFAVADFIVDSDRSEQLSFAPPMRTAGGVRLLPNRPNPFLEQTELLFEVPGSGPVEVRIHDIAGRHVKTLRTSVTGPGVGSLVWNGSDQSGTEVAAGIYFARVESADGHSTRKIIHLK